MKLVVMSSLSPKDLGLLIPLNERWPLDLVIQPDWSQSGPAKQSRWSKFRRSPATMISRRLQRPFYNGHTRRLDREITAHCFGSPGLPSLAAPRVLVPHREVNSNAAAEMIRGAEPDVMITSSCPLLKSSIFNIPRFGTLNIHWGIAPHYRGDHTVFWPLYYGDYENIGVTIHRIDDGIDTGPVLAQGFPQLEPHDTEASLYAKCARLTAEMLNSVLEQISTTGTLEALPSTSGGRLFRERDRNVWHELGYAARRTFGLRNIPARPERRLIAAANSELVLT